MSRQGLQLNSGAGICFASSLWLKGKFFIHVYNELGGCKAHTMPNTIQDETCKASRCKIGTDES